MSNLRNHNRLEKNAAIFLEMLSMPGSDSSNNILLCNALDLSLEGVRVCVDEPIEVHSVLQMGIQLQGMDQPFYMVGEVRWCTQSAEGEPGFWVGFELLDSAGTDYDTWHQLTELL